MTVYVWGFSSKFAVYEPANGSNPDACSKHEAKPPLRDWMPPSLSEVFEIRGVPAPAGDFPATTGFQHLVSPRAAEVLNETLNESGLLYPVDVPGLAGGRWHVFQPTRVVDCLNLEASKVTKLPFPPHRISAIVDPVFYTDRVPSAGVFLVPECTHGDIYVCENVKALVVAAGLKGFVLSEGYFGEPWVS